MFCWCFIISCISINGVFPHLCLFVFSHADVFSLSGLRTSSVEGTRQNVTLCSFSFPCSTSPVTHCVDIFGWVIHTCAFSTVRNRNEAVSVAHNEMSVSCLSR